MGINLDVLGWCWWIGSCPCTGCNLAVGVSTRCAGEHMLALACWNLYPSMPIPMCTGHGWVSISGSSTFEPLEFKMHTSFHLTWHMLLIETMQRTSKDHFHQKYPFGPPRKVHSLGKNENSKLFPKAPAYQHRKNNDVKNLTVKFWRCYLHNVTSIQHQKSVRNEILASQLPSFCHIYPASQELYPVP